MKVGAMKLLRAGMYDASKSLEHLCSGDGSHGDVENEETEGSSRSQKESWKHMALK